jgi:hypothetical protein
MKVIAYSLWGSRPMFIHGALVNARECREYLPDWSVRVYHDESINQSVLEELKELGVTCILVKGEGSYGSFWRFKPMFEGHDAFMSRDIDSRITWRDLRCIQEWMNSGKKYMIIRDHEEHYKTHVMAGMFGVRGSVPEELETDMVRISKCHAYTADQFFLAQHLWPHMQDHVEFGYRELEWMKESWDPKNHVGLGFDEYERPRLDHGTPGEPCEKIRHVFYPQKGMGLGNLFIQLTEFFYMFPDGLVHESIKDNEVGRWLKFHFEITDRTDLPVYSSSIVINETSMRKVHPLIRRLISPSDEMRILILKNIHLVHGVKAGLQIRRGGAALDSVALADPGHEFANDDAVQKFLEIYKQNSPVFLASDSPETKKLFPEARTLDTTIAVIHSEYPTVDTKDRSNIFLDFFLLSLCPKVYFTGGKFPETPGLSTFGYMAGVYGENPWEIVPNQ